MSATLRVDHSFSSSCLFFMVQWDAPRSTCPVPHAVLRTIKYIDHDQYLQSNYGWGFYLLLNPEMEGKCTLLLRHSWAIYIGSVKKKKKKVDNVRVKKWWSFLLLKRYVFYPIHMEVKENAQEQAKASWSLVDDDPKVASCCPRIPPSHQVIWVQYPRIPPTVHWLREGGSRGRTTVSRWLPDGQRASSQNTHSHLNSLDLCHC